MVSALMQKYNNLSLLSGEKCVLAMKRLIYIVPTGLNRLGGCFLFYQNFAPIGAVPLGTKYW